MVVTLLVVVVLLIADDDKIPCKFVRPRLNNRIGPL